MAESDHCPHAVRCAHRVRTIALAARIQLVTVRRPRAKTAPRKSIASRGMDRRSRTEARRKNHWHRAGVECEDVIRGGSVGVSGWCGNRQTDRQVGSTPRRW